MRTFILLLLFFVLALRSQAEINYRDLSIEQRGKELKKVVQSSEEQQTPQETIDALERERNLIVQQLTIITGDEDTRYNIVPGDTLKIIYKDQARMISGVYQVNGQGEIALPLVGNVKVTGFNRRDARQYLNQIYTEYIRDPQVTIEINTVGKYIVMGAAGPGVFHLEPDITVMDAILKTGFDSHRTNLGSVLVMRGGRDNPQILKLNLKKMMLKGDRSDNIVIKPNDLIYVPNSFFYNLDTVKDKLLSYVADYYTLGGSTILKTESKSPVNETSSP